MQSYDALPDFAAYSMKCFTKIEMFSMALMYEKYPAALSCHKERMEMFGAETAFDRDIAPETQSKAFK